MESIIDKTLVKNVRIRAHADKVWETITNPRLMKLWMSEEKVDILSGWTVGSTFIVHGELSGKTFENRGSIHQFEPGKIFSYSYSSSLWPQHERNHQTMVTFTLDAHETYTQLNIEQNYFVNDVDYKHVAFYWNNTADIIRQLAESMMT